MSEIDVKIQISETTRDNLLEFTMNYLLEQPTNFEEFAKDHFRRMKSRRHAIRVYEEEEEKSSSSENVNKLVSKSSIVRRKSIYGESYDPRSMSRELYVKPVHEKTPEESETLHKVAKDTLIFRGLDEIQLEDVINAMFKKTVREGDVIIKQGDLGDNFYVIETGIFHVYLRKDKEEPIHVHTYNNSGSFGELALLYNQPRAATVTAMSDGILWALDRGTFKRLILQSAFEKRQRHQELIENTPLLKNLDSYDRLNLADVFVTKRAKKGEMITKQGELPTGMYLIESGKVAVRAQTRDGKYVDIAKVVAGEFFGDMALLKKQRRLFSAYAEEDTRLAYIDEDAFRRFMGPCLDEMNKMYMKHVENLVSLFGPNYTNVLDLKSYN